MASPDRTISVLALFTLERPAWTVEEAAADLDVSESSAYRYFATLLDAGFLTTEQTGRYILGPAFLQYDRQIQLTDPLLRAARPVMNEMAAYAPDGTTIVLCRVFRESVLCVHEVLSRGPQPRVSYERGRPMPLFRGATSKIILAYLPARKLQRLYGAQAAEIRKAGLGDDWQAFRASLAELRRVGYSVTRHEVDAGRAGIAAPILDSSRKVLGSLSLIATESEVNETRVLRLASLVTGAAREIEGVLGPRPAGSLAEASD